MKGMDYLDISADDDLVAKRLNDPEWVMQQKLDGARVLAHLGFPEGSGPIFRQRNDEGMKFAAVGQHLKAIHADLPVFDHPVILDGEVIPSTGLYHIWDLIDPEHLDQPYGERLAALYETVANTVRVRTVRTALSPQDKVWLFNRLEAAGAEGVMAKSVVGTYRPGVRVSDAVKVKFTRTAEVIVLEVDRPDARHGSASLGVYRATGRGGSSVLVKVGACSLIGKPLVQPGDVIEVTYLHSGTGADPVMYQPRMTKVRPDKDALECTTAQFRQYTREVF